MSEPKDENEAACGGSALTAELGTLADQFECHAASRSIDQIEETGRAMRAAKAEIERLQARIDALMLEYCPDEMTPEQIAEWERHQTPIEIPTLDEMRALLTVPNA